MKIKAVIRSTKTSFSSAKSFPFLFAVKIAALQKQPHQALIPFVSLIHKHSDYAINIYSPVNDLVVIRH